MQKQMIATLAALSTLVLTSACSGTATGGNPESPPVVDPDPAPPRKLDSADASVPIEDDAGRCGGFPFNDKACGTCGASKCCDVAATCMNDAECRALETCIGTCTDTTCTNACATDHPRGVAKLNAIGTCAETKCAAACETTPPAPEPASKGIGDRCSDDSECRDGNCSGTPGWCTRSCTSNSSCAGYPQLNNEFGKFNYCLQTAAGNNSCFPGCSTNADCTKYASGLTCQSAGNGVFVCSL